MPRYARLAARLLLPPEGDGKAKDWPGRTLVVDALSVALQARARRASRRRWMPLAAAAALMFATAAVLVARRPADGIHARDDRGEILNPGTVLRAETDRAVTVSLSTGSRLRLSRGGRLELAEIGLRQRFVLQAGRVRAQVAPLTPDQRFLVSTPDIEVEVRGTSFEVAVVPARAECDGSATEVRVFEGVVMVRRPGQASQQWQVAAGEHWPADCRSAPAGAPTAGVPPPVSQPQAAPRRSGRLLLQAPPAMAASRAGASQANLEASTLAQQNDLFAAAMEARRRGDLLLAGQRLDELLARFPSGALAETARSERAKLSRGPAAASAP